MASFHSGPATPLQHIAQPAKPEPGHSAALPPSSQAVSVSAESVSPSKPRIHIPLDPIKDSQPMTRDSADIAQDPITFPPQTVNSTPAKQVLESSLGSVTDESDGSGPDYYTSDSGEDSDFECHLSEKQKVKRAHLKAERDDIKPSYYYGEKEAEEEALRKGVGKPHYKRKGLRGVPVFEPRMEQFEDFYGYINKIDRWGMRSGIVKIIPPKEWSAELPNLGEESLRTDGKGQMLKRARIKSPINQVIQGNRGLFRVMNVAKRKNYNALEWYDLANSADYRPPDFFTPPEPSTSGGGEGNAEASLRSTRSTRSSRRQTTHVTPILSKQPINRKRKPLPTANLDQNADSSFEATSDLGSTLLTPGLTTNITDALNKPTAPDPQLAVAPRSVERNVTPPTAGSVSICPPHVFARADSPTPVSGPNTHSASTLPHDPVIPIEGAPPAEASTFASTSPSDSKPCPDQNGQPNDPALAGLDTALADETISSHPDTAVSQTADQESTPAKKPKRTGPPPPSDEEWAEFVKCYDKLPYGAQKSDYTTEACRIIEQEYWRTIGNGGEPMYGADTTGTLFDERTKHWNVSNLDNLLNRLKLRKKIPGVNTPYLYFGTWRATFAWHVEDADLYSINYIHFGAPKFWYSIPQEHNERFENFMTSSFAKERFTCPQFLRHKAFLASPSVLSSCGIQLNRVVHLPGEIIITYPYGYHSGFNLGYNCAESVNFANEAWIEKGKKAKFCKCIDDAVTINVEAWLHEHEKASERDREAERKNAEKAERADQKRKRELEPKPLTIKKPRPPTDPNKVTKKIKLDPSAKNSQDYASINSLPNDPLQALAGPSDASTLALTRPPSKKVKTDTSSQPRLLEGEISKTPTIRVSKPKASSKKFYPCALCPDQSEDNLVRIIEEPQALKVSPPVQPTGLPTQLAPSCSTSSHQSALSSIDPSIISSVCVPHVPVSSQSHVNGSAIAPPRPKPIRRAHKICCMFIPSTWIEQLPTGEEVAKGVGNIEKARWALKCQLCNDKMGAKVQCTKTQKCAKACHVTCALKTGLFFIDAQLNHENQTYSLLEPPPNGFPPDLNVENNINLVVLCKQHNPEFKRAEAERKSKELAEKIAGFVSSQSIKVRTSNGIFQVFFHSQNAEKKTIRVTFEDGHTADIAYGRVYFGPNSPEAGKEDDGKEKQGSKSTATKSKSSRPGDGSAAIATKRRKTDSVNPPTPIHPELYNHAPIYQHQLIGHDPRTFDRRPSDSQLTSLQANGSSASSSVASGTFPFLSSLDVNHAAQAPSWNVRQSAGEPGQQQMGVNGGLLNICDDEKLRMLANLSTGGGIEGTIQSTAGPIHHPSRTPSHFIDPRFQV